MLDGDQVKAGNAGQVGTQSSRLSAVHIEEAADTRFSQIRIDQQGAITELRQGDG